MFSVILCKVFDVLILETKMKLLFLFLSLTLRDGLGLGTACLLQESPAFAREGALQPIGPRVFVAEVKVIQFGDFYIVSNGVCHYFYQ